MPSAQIRGEIYCKTIQLHRTCAYLPKYLFHKRNLINATAERRANDKLLKLLRACLFTFCLIMFVSGHI
jgi:hypothetical protein